MAKSKVNKGEVIKTYLTESTLTNTSDKKAAFKTFTKTTKCDASYARFCFVWKEVLGEATGVSLTPTVKVKTVVKLKDITKIHFPDSVLTPIKSGTPMDVLVSTDGGTMPATITVAPGESGVGKTTVLLEYLGQLKKANPTKRILFISSEMNDLHLFKYSKRIKFQGVEIMLLGDYKEDPCSAIEQVFAKGWDVILLDSIQDAVNKIVASGSHKTTQAENWLLAEMDKTRTAKNELGLYTAFYCTNHFTKGETYAGSANLKHMTDAMVLFRADETDDTYIEYVKNRDGSSKKKLYFKITQNGVVFNAQRFAQDETTKVEIEKLHSAVSAKNEEWDSIFNSSIPLDTKGANQEKA